MTFITRRFANAPEGTAALFFIVSRLLPAALDRYPRGLTGHVAHPNRSIQIFATLGFAARDEAFAAARNWCVASRVVDAAKS